MAFFPPELAMQREFDEMQGSALGAQTDLLREIYFQKLHTFGKVSTEFDRELVNLVLEHAKKVIAHPSRPTVTKLENFLQSPFGELALEESIEENPFLNDPETLLVEQPEEKPFSCVAMLDCSASMSGEKHLLASIAVAVLLLEVPPKDTSLVTFASDATTIKKLSVEEAREETVLRFLRTQPKGFTNISRGLEEGLIQLRGQSGRKRKVGLIATDGRSTEGGDPLLMAKEYDFLVVLHLHGPGSHIEASQQLAQQGHGICLETETFEELPKRLYEALRLLARM
jgi:hypothetical protein